MTPGTKTQPLEDIQNIAWNRQVQHILASVFSTRCVIWDLRKNETIIKLSDTQSRVRFRALQWHPSIATQLWLASEDDQAPFVQLWDLRYATAPAKVRNHTTFWQTCNDFNNICSIGSFHRHWKSMIAVFSVWHGAWKTPIWWCLVVKIIRFCVGIRTVNRAMSAYLRLRRRCNGIRMWFGVHAIRHWLPARVWTVPFRFIRWTAVFNIRCKPAIKSPTHFRAWRTLHRHRHHKQPHRFTTATWNAHPNGWNVPSVSNLV